MANTRFHRAVMRAHTNTRLIAVVLGVLVCLAWPAPTAEAGRLHTSWSHGSHISGGTSYRSARWSRAHRVHYTHRVHHHRASSRHGYAVWVPARYSRPTYYRRYSSRTLYRSRVPSRFTLVEVPPASPATVRIGTGSGLDSRGGASGAAGNGFRAWQAAVRHQPAHRVVPLGSEGS